MSDASAASGRGDPVVDDPDTLLGRVLDALRRGPEEGAAVLHGALTARARGPLGGEAGLRRALGNPLLAPLVGHTDAQVAPWDRRAEAARTTVAVTGPHGVARYLVAARRDDAGWRLSGLQRDDLPPS